MFSIRTKSIFIDILEKNVNNFKNKQNNLKKNNLYKFYFKKNSNKLKYTVD